MSELVFPITATLLLYGILMPLLSLVARAIWRRRRARNPHPHEGGARVNLLLITAPVVVPAAAFLGAAFHQLDGHHARDVCMAVHDIGEACGESGILVMLVLAPLALVLPRLVRRTPRRGVVHARLSTRYGVEVRVVDEAVVCTRGYLRPWVELGATCLDDLSDAELDAALLHEVAHAEARDPFFSALARACVTLNPMGFLLREAVVAWELGREVRADLTAARVGADRFELASSLVKVAGLGYGRSTSAATSNLTGAAASIRLRVAVLMDSRLPSVGNDRRTLAFGVAVVVAVFLLFGVCDMPMLDALHLESEHLFAHVSETSHHH